MSGIDLLRTFRKPFKPATKPVVTYNRETRRLAERVGVPPPILIAMQRAGVIQRGQHRVQPGVTLRFLREGMKAAIAAGAKP